ncbi:TBC1 domain family member 7-like [Anneissia japonica]|uniref:TBC1 domain family member 7-like n=1 Tax=Anneissia japonica TaxID=1529436 RepID=UPI0014254FCF|nr:TBC1 domain family member 7-like [Anneissia japonica]
MTEDRNFRSHYYEKVGFRGVEEKKSLQILLKDDPLDDQKLAVFCQRFPVPVMYRQLVWKVLLGILPVHQSVHQFVWNQRTQQCNDLQRSLKVMNIINDETSEAEVIFKMFLLQEGLLPLEDENLHDIEDSIISLDVATATCDMTEDFDDAYWLAFRIYQLREKHADLLETMPSSFISYLTKEDPVLYEHLEALKCVKRLPYQKWFQSLFSSVFPVSTVERIWDRFIGGSCKFLVFVAIAIFLTYKMQLINTKKQQDLLKFLEKLPCDHCDVILMKASELWEKYGCTKAELL